ncbi:hypothetical protein B0H11DRAFT_1974557 [Mycena galericulata]|nr:hypothetical protein B0H11DRAFT_1974557 [Mycena galericulata]
MHLSTLIVIALAHFTHIRGAVALPAQDIEPGPVKTFNVTEIMKRDCTLNSDGCNHFLGTCTTNTDCCGCNCIELVCVSL